jgi:hypothetical protein
MQDKRVSILNRKLKKMKNRMYNRNKKFNKIMKKARILKDRCRILYKKLKNKKIK